MIISYKYYKNGRIDLLIDNVNVGKIIIIDEEEPAPYIIKLEIKEKYRNKGFGKILMKHVFEIYRFKESISLYVALNNIDAIRFYRSLGFFIALTNKRKNPHYLMVKKFIV